MEGAALSRGRLRWRRGVRPVRRSAEVDDTMVAAYAHGVGQITEALMGEHVSRSTVSRAAKTLGLTVESSLRPFQCYASPADVLPLPHHPRSRVGWV